MMNPRLAMLVAILLAAAAFRLFPHPPNVTPIAAMALFGGVFLQDRRLAFVIPLSALMLSDLVLGFHSSMIFVYSAFAMTVLIGIMVRGHRSTSMIIGAALTSSLLFFFLSNFGAWLGHAQYPQTFSGLMAAYTAGIPFFRNTLIGDLFFTALFFGGFYLAQQRIPQLRERAPKA